MGTKVFSNRLALKPDGTRIRGTQLAPTAHETKRGSFNKLYARNRVLAQSPRRGVVVLLGALTTSTEEGDVKSRPPRFYPWRKE